MAILLPPLGVFLQVGFKLQFWINVVVTLLGYVPVTIHGIYIILSRGDVTSLPLRDLHRVRGTLGRT